MPLVRQKLWGRLCSLRAMIAHLSAHLRRLTEPRRFHHIVFVAGSLAVAVFAVFNVLYTTATTVVFDGVELGTVANEAEAQAARMSVEQSISSILGYDYTVEDSKVSYSTGLTFRSAVVDEARLEEALSDTLRVVEHGYALYVGGTFIGATQTEGALEQLLEQVAAPYRNENTVSIGFVEEVEIRECYLPGGGFHQFGGCGAAAQQHQGRRSHLYRGEGRLLVPDCPGSQHDQQGTAGAEPRL